MNEICNRYHLPIIVVENGLGTHDTMEVGGRIRDNYRTDHLWWHIEQMRLAAEEDGVDLVGCTPWGCIDLVPTSTGGIAERCGFVYVDRSDDGTEGPSRRRRDSFHWYKKVIKTSGEAL